MSASPEADASTGDGTAAAQAPDTCAAAARIMFDVHGSPAPQAGMRAVNTARGPRAITTGGKNLNTWRADVTTAAMWYMTERGGDFPLDGPLRLAIHFWFPMPTSRPKRIQAKGHAWKTSAPDLDKLIRAVGDSIVAAGMVRDDARFVDIHATKNETVGWTGASIILEAAS